jgi:hypothetical protein
MKLTDLKELTIYLVFINVLTFLLYGIDKWKARRGKWPGSSSPYNLDNLSTKWTIWHFYGDKKSIIPALVPALQYP